MLYHLDQAVSPAHSTLHLHGWPKILDQPYITNPYLGDGWIMLRERQTLLVDKSQVMVDPHSKRGTIHTRLGIGNVWNEMRLHREKGKGRLCNDWRGNNEKGPSMKIIYMPTILPSEMRSMRTIVLPNHENKQQLGCGQDTNLKIEDTNSHPPKDRRHSKYPMGMSILQQPHPNMVVLQRMLLQTTIAIVNHPLLSLHLHRCLHNNIFRRRLRITKEKSLSVKGSRSNRKNKD
jgi:hypothetical protein